MGVRRKDRQLSSTRKTAVQSGQGRLNTCVGGRTDPAEEGVGYEG